MQRCIKPSSIDPNLFNNLFQPVQHHHLIHLWLSLPRAGNYEIVYAGVPSVILVQYTKWRNILQSPQFIYGLEETHTYPNGLFM